MERPLRIFETDEDANPIALAESRLMPNLLPWDYAATRARRTIDLRVARSDDAALWAFAMLSVSELVSKFPLYLVMLVLRTSTCFGASPDPRGWCTWTPRGPTCPRPKPGRVRVRHSDGSRSGRRTRRRGGSSSASARSRETRIFGCASSWGFPPRRRHTIRRRRRRRKKKKTGGRFSLTGESPHPRHRSRLRWLESRRLGRA
jgi:hypothetical protein